MRPEIGLFRTASVFVVVFMILVSVGRVQKSSAYFVRSDDLDAAHYWIRTLMANPFERAIDR